jgi:transposase
MREPHLNDCRCEGLYSNLVRHKDRSVLEQWRKSKNKRKWEKAVVILESNNLSMNQISAKIERPVEVVRKWIKVYDNHGIKGIEKKRKIPDRSKYDKIIIEKKNRILEILHQNPRLFGINRTNWNCKSISNVYKKEYGENIHASTVARYLRNNSNYKIGKSRKVLTSPDPNYREKVDLLLKILHSLKPEEMLFFIDELGPLRVKKYGGRCYIKKGEVLNIPQTQISKGSVTLYGALSATTNQVTWSYGNTKNSSGMIDLVETLFNQFHDKSKLYITWDAASWHSSNELLDWLDCFNAETSSIADGPIIEFIPLPSNSQFLNVIESVFGGMKKAVIHHSNYQSEEEMKLAISLHFKERNDYFKENPKRVGKKIWEIDFFKDYKNIKSGNYKQW